jgi:hypothetical protein
MQTAQRRLSVHSSKGHPLRTFLLVVVLVAVAVAYFGGVEGIETDINPSALIDAVFG